LRLVQILQDVNQSVKIAQDQQKHEEIASNLDISMLKGYSQIIGVSNHELSQELTPQKLIHYGILKFNNTNHDCLLFERFFVITTRSTRQFILKIETVKTEVFTETGSVDTISETIYPVMQIDHNFNISLDGVKEEQFEFTIESTLPKQKLLVKCPLLGDKKGWIKAIDDALLSQKTLRHRSGLQCSSVHISEATSTPTSSDNGVIYDFRTGDLKPYERNNNGSDVKLNRHCSVLEGLKNENSDDFFDNVLDDFDKILAKYS